MNLSYILRHRRVDIKYLLSKKVSILEALAGAIMNSKITVEDCLCLTNPCRDFAVFAVVKPLFIRQI